MALLDGWRSKSLIESLHLCLYHLEIIRDRQPFDDCVVPFDQHADRLVGGRELLSISLHCRFIDGFLQTSNSFSRLRKPRLCYDVLSADDVVAKEIS